MKLRKQIVDVAKYIMHEIEQIKLELEVPS